MITISGDSTQFYDLVIKVHDILFNKKEKIEVKLELKQPIDPNLFRDFITLLQDLEKDFETEIIITIVEGENNDKE